MKLIYNNLLRYIEKDKSGTKKYYKFKKGKDLELDQEIPKKYFTGLETGEFKIIENKGYYILVDKYNVPVPRRGNSKRKIQINTQMLWSGKLKPYHFKPIKEALIEYFSINLKKLKSKKLNTPIEVRYTFYVNQENNDLDNLEWIYKKVFHDFLVKKKIIKDDTISFINKSVTEGIISKNEKLIIEIMERKVLLIDGEMLCYMCCFRKKEEEHILGDITIQEAIEKIKSILNHLVHKLDTRQYIGFFSGANNFRYEIAKERPYKEGRSEKPDLFYTLKNFLIKKYKFKIANEIEADDALAICSKHFGVENCIIVSHDSDMLQLIGTHYNPIKHLLREVDGNEARFNFFRKMLTGCSTDNVPGVPQIGKVKSKKILDNTKVQDYASKVKKCFIDYYGEEKGNERYEEVYNLIRLKMSKDDFIIPEINYL